MSLTPIFIVAIIAWALVRLFGSGRERGDIKGKWQDAENKMTELEMQIETMSERIKVLEQIVTDEKYDLNRQFDDLNK